MNSLRLTATASPARGSCGIDGKAKKVVVVVVVVVVVSSKGSRSAPAGALADGLQGWWPLGGWESGRMELGGRSGGAEGTGDRDVGVGNEKRGEEKKMAREEEKIINFQKGFPF